MMKNEQLARDFINWYAVNMETLKHYVKDYDEDLFTDAFLRAVSAIERRGTVVNNYMAYFLTTYRATFLDSKKGTQIQSAEDWVLKGLPTQNFNSALYEEVVETLNAEMLEYVRTSFDEFSISLFEIYVGLLPDISYTRLSGMLRISEPRIRQRIGPIKKQVAAKFSDRKEYLLSIV